MVLGDYELNQLQDSTGVTSLFVILISVGVIILLNVLIAVVSDSYERATIRCIMLFGRARAAFVAQNESLENFLRPGDIPKQALPTGLTQRKFVRYLLSIGRWVVLMAIIGTAIDTAIALIQICFGSIRDARTTNTSMPFSVILRKYTVDFRVDTQFPVLFFHRFHTLVCFVPGARSTSRPYSRKSFAKCRVARFCSFPESTEAFQHQICSLAGPHISWAIIVASTKEFRVIWG